MDMILEAEPSLKRSAAVFSDGCRTFGKVIDSKFPLAFHGVDRNHVEQNIFRFMKDKLELSESGFRKLKKKVKDFLRGNANRQGLYDYEDRMLAANNMEREIKTWPAALAKYIRTNKEEILLGVHTLAARKTAGLTREDGQTDSVWSQASESAHMVVTRWLEDEPPTYKNIFQSMEHYFDCKVTETNLARHGSSPNGVLKDCYKYLEFDARKFANTPEANRPNWIQLERKDLLGRNGLPGLAENTKSYKVIEQKEFSFLDDSASSDDSDTSGGSASLGSDARLASYVCPLDLGSDALDSLKNRRARDSIIDQALIAAGICENEYDCLGLVTCASQILERGIFSNELESKIRFVSSLTTAAHHTVTGRLAEALTCNCKSGSSKSGNTKTNLCGHNISFVQQRAQ